MSQFEIHTFFSALHRESIHSPQRIRNKNSTPAHKTQILPSQIKHTFSTAVYEKAGHSVRRYLKCLKKKKNGMEEYLISDIFGLIISVCGFMDVHI